MLRWTGVYHSIGPALIKYTTLNLDGCVLLKILKDKLNFIHDKIEWKQLIEQDIYVDDFVRSTCIVIFVDTCNFLHGFRV